MTMLKMKAIIGRYGEANDRRIVVRIQSGVNNF